MVLRPDRTGPDRPAKGYSRVYLIQLYIFHFLYICSLLFRTLITRLYYAKYYRLLLVILFLYKIIAKCLDVILRPIVYLIIISKWKISYYSEKLSDRQKQLIFNVVTILPGIVLSYSFILLNIYTNFTPPRPRPAKS